MRFTWDGALTAVLTGCALLTTALVARHEYVARQQAPAQAEQRPTFVKNWRSDLADGARLGSTDAPVQLIEFADFECPYCSGFHVVLKSLRERYPTQVNLTFVHFPLPMHRFAVPAARAAECAAAQGRFEAMYDQLFAGQNEFGLKAWDDYAAAAAVPDLKAFDACVRNTDPIPRVEAGKALGAKLDVRATPTLVVNGWKLERPPTQDELDGMVKNILAGRSPLDGKS
jgi:protein-disulfide isomerase